MELKLTIYTDKKCKEIQKTLIVNDFELSTGVCEDVLQLMKVDHLDGISALSEESQTELLLETITNNLSQFKDLLKNVFDDLTDEDLSKTKIKEVMTVISQIVKYSFSNLFSAFATGNQKN